MFSVQIEKENENGNAITYKIKFIDSVIFKSSLLSILADNLAEELHKDKSKDCKLDLGNMTVNDGSLRFKCIDYKKNYEIPKDLHIL